MFGHRMYKEIVFSYICTSLVLNDTIMDLFLTQVAEQPATLTANSPFKPDQHTTPHDAIRHTHNGLRIHRFDSSRRRRRLDVADDTRNDPDDGPPVGTAIRRDRPRARRQARPVPRTKHLDPTPD